MSRNALHEDSQFSQRVPRRENMCAVFHVFYLESMRRQGVAMPTNSLQFDNDLERELDHVCYTKLLAYLTVQGAKKRQFNSFETHNALAK